jgi:hypothetical protein
MAKKIFHDMNVNYKAVELDMLEYGNQFQDALHKMTGERTVSTVSALLLLEMGWCHTTPRTLDFPASKSKPDISADYTLISKWQIYKETSLIEYETA